MLIQAKVNEQLYDSHRLPSNCVMLAQHVHGKNKTNFISYCHSLINCLFYRAGVGSALEGGKGRAGTKLFQDFQMLSRIWTHPWCLQLDYISKENKVNEQRHTTGELRASLPSSALKLTQGTLQFLHSHYFLRTGRQACRAQQ